MAGDLLNLQTKQLSDLQLAAELDGHELVLILQGGKYVVANADQVGNFAAAKSTAAKTRYLIEDGQPVRIAWQTEYINGTTITYAQKHGLVGADVRENDWDADNKKWAPNTPASFYFEEDTDGHYEYLNLVPQVLKAEFIII